ncbi:MAG: GNAT family N-acetyltransferase [Homoserinimonas sp.]|nr:GNAT family N-acetyltransferase [Homoserinimonas sp.]MCW5944849.1 GNAT family N-acetyltransferase [Cryobacterium sp.]
MTASRPEPAILSGRFVRLEPFEDAHLPGLFEAIAKPEVFEFGYGGGLAALPRDEAEFANWSAGRRRPENNIYTVILNSGPDAGKIVGTTTLGDFDIRREATHIGWTAYAPEVWGTAVNPEAKLLLLDCAFGSGFGRVKIQTDVLNLHSCAAIEKLGATFEGVVRREQPRADGTWRDTAQYAIIIDDWPEVRKKIESRLAAWS